MPRPSPQSYLLRLWREQTDMPLRATLMSVGQPAETRHFASLAELHVFLCAQGETTSEEHPSPINCTRSTTD